jgi:hypothetical protein
VHVIPSQQQLAKGSQSPCLQELPGPVQVLGSQFPANKLEKIPNEMIPIVNNIIINKNTFFISFLLLR